MFKKLTASTAIALTLATFARAEAPMAFDVAEDHTRIHMAAAPRARKRHARAWQCFYQPRLHLSQGHVGRRHRGRS